jgi:hypothetical protein
MPSGSIMLVVKKTVTGKSELNVLVVQSKATLHKNGLQGTYTCVMPLAY